MNTILLVEDNPHIMKINHAALMMEGYRILEAATAAECLIAMLLTATPRLIYYLPVLIAAGMLAGLFTGLCAQFLLQHMKKLPPG